VIGTSMVLTLVTMVIATMLHALTNHLVDAVAGADLMVGRRDRGAVRRAWPGRRFAANTCGCCSGS